MKLFYDMLVPFMPDSEMDAEGKLVPSESKIAGRQAMIELSNFQTSGNIICLYNAVFQACLYAKVDLVDKITNLPETVEIPEVSINEAVDICAKMLFQSVKPENTFDIDKFICILLTSAHFAIEAINKENSEKSEVDKKDDIPVEDKQITIDEVVNDTLSKES